MVVVALVQIQRRDIQSCTCGDGQPAGQTRDDRRLKAEMVNSCELLSQRQNGLSESFVDIVVWEPEGCTDINYLATDRLTGWRLNADTRIMTMMMMVMVVVVVIIKMDSV